MYCAQAFRRQGRGLEKARLCIFPDAERALLEGGRMRRRAPGVIVYEIVIDPEAELIGEPRALARFGDVPALA